MNNEASSKHKTTSNEKMDTSTADRGIIPAEVAARMDREGDDFRTTANEQAEPESINVTGGATVDQEGLANNYAIEPEMYVDEPGDLPQDDELVEVNEDSEGKLSTQGDQRGKGPGII